MDVNAKEGSYISFSSEVEFGLEGSYDGIQNCV
jgi:hypothetical protein